jgi:chorismate dehydratase
VGVVSYLNTKPLLYGIQHSDIIYDIELMIDYPSNIATMLLQDEIDIGLVPVAMIPRMKYHEIITSYCIGSDGPVASVCIFSELPIEQVQKVLLDYQSETSVQLAKILIRDYWMVQPELIDAKEGFRDHIKGTTAALVIGDRALEQRKISKYVYDLGDAWKQFTGLPFVFATWISNKKLDSSFKRAFEHANEFGVNNLKALLTNLQYDCFDLNQYYTRYISYNLDSRKMKGLRLFLQKLKKL